MAKDVAAFLHSVCCWWRLFPLYPLFFLLVITFVVERTKLNRTSYTARLYHSSRYIKRGTPKSKPFTFLFSFSFSFSFARILAFHRRYASSLSLPPRPSPTKTNEDVSSAPNALFCTKRIYSYQTHPFAQNASVRTKRIHSNKTHSPTLAHVSTLRAAFCNFRFANPPPRPNSPLSC